MFTRRALLFGASLSALLAGARANAETVTYTYDELGRLKTATYSNGATITYSYDPAGNRTQLVQTAPTALQASLSANPTTITVGQSSSLTWSTANATSASINNGVGTVTPTAGGSVSVSPTVTTTYTLTANGTGGPVTSQATVTVNASGFNQTIAITGTGPVNLRTLADSAGYNGAQNATVTFTLASNITITGAAGAPNGGIAIDTGTWPTGSYAINLTLQITGKVRGGGARGGKGAVSPNAEAGGVGGDAIYCRLPISITVNSGGEVRAGGGGGGGGGGSRDSTLELDWVGGGGGGGFPNGTGGATGDPIFDGNVGSATAGAAGTASGGGAGGPGEASGAGGAGGGAGAAGSNGQAGGVSGAFRSPGAGGVAGYAIRKNGHIVPVTNNGTITDTQG